MLNKLRATFPEFDWRQDSPSVPLSIEVPQERVGAPVGDKFEVTVWGPKVPRGPCYHAFLWLVQGNKTLIHVPSCFSPVKAMEAMQLQITLLDEAVGAFETVSGLRTSPKETPMSENNPKIHYGKKVRVASKLSNRDFNVLAIETRQPGAMGVIVGHHDSHGLCFKVDHEDGTSSCYDLDELMEVRTAYIRLTNEPQDDCDGCINHCENDGGDPHCLAFGLDLIGQWTVGAGGPIGMRCSECQKQNAGLSTCQISERVVDISSGSVVFMDAE